MHTRCMLYIWYAYNISGFQMEIEDCVLDALGNSSRVQLILVSAVLFGQIYPCPGGLNFGGGFCFLMSGNSKK